MQGVADDQQVVIDHHGQKKDIQYYIQYYRVYAKIHMADAPFIGYNFSLCVHQHLWNCGGDKTDGYKGRLERQKYVGMWRWESELMAGMLSKFPNTVIMYMEEKKLKCEGLQFWFF